MKFMYDSPHDVSVDKFYCNCFSRFNKSVKVFNDLLITQHTRHFLVATYWRNSVMYGKRH